MKKLLVFTVVVLSLLLVYAFLPKGETKERRPFSEKRDLISLHYDHAADKDDGQSAAADRSILESLFGADWIREHVVAVSGAYGENADIFNPESDAVMDAVWNERGGWLEAHERRPEVVRALTQRWGEVLEGGGDVWVKEGGQSDLTAEVVRQLQRRYPDLETSRRIHVVQHSGWNEEQTTDADLAYVKAQTDYIRIRDANNYLNIEGGDAAFVEAAKNHPRFGPQWRAAFDYFDPQDRLDFSDTGELMHMLGLGEMGIDQFRERFLAPPQRGE